jgi:hypothetical protein
MIHRRGRREILTAKDTENDPPQRTQRNFNRKGHREILTTKDTERFLTAEDTEKFYINISN